MNFKKISIQRDLQTNPYDSAYIMRLFDEMTETYGFMNLVSSFGFTAIWRNICVSKIQSAPVKKCCDLMSGMGELLPGVIRRFREVDEVVAIDISPEMCSKILSKKERLIQLAGDCKTRESFKLDVRQEDIFGSSLPSNYFDCIVCSFGLKTLSIEQQYELAVIVKRILKPGGVFSFIEISVPQRNFLKAPFLFYLRNVVPEIGRVALGNPDSYAMLGFYVQNFVNAETFCEFLKDQGLDATCFGHFFGCASGVFGSKV